MEEKVVIMVLNVDLECSRCYKKVKKVLAKFPQIRDQVYNEKQNAVMIKVVCCKPEKIRDKICCKGGGSIKSIEIKELEKKKEPEKKEEEKKKDTEKKKEPEKKEGEKKKEPEKKEGEKKKEPEKKEGEKKKEPEKKEGEKKNEGEKKKEPEPVKVAQALAVQGYPPPAYPVFCCASSYEGRPCYHGYGMAAPPPCYLGRPIYDSYGGGRGYYVSNSDYYNQENSTECIVM